MTEDAVLVDYPDRASEKNVTKSADPIKGDNLEVSEPDLVPDEGGASQIVSIGTKEDQYAFTFHEEKLNRIMAKIPAGWKISVVGVVGAFRTGKSFVLSWFLHYLNHLKDNKDPSSESWYKSVTSIGMDEKEGFGWRGGSERNTTGIWIWSEPQFLRKENGENIAVLLVDTQGMFDNETTMALTASIFGLSTLISSYQIYNVDKRIQEDNLQQLALFSEYARLAMTTNYGDESESDEFSGKPFQRIEFLVRDWQHFDEEDDFDEMGKEMDEYLKKVIAERDATDLKETREQILGCFEQISCYGLVHPGSSVTKKKYSGDIKVIDPTFVELLDRYCKKIFNPETLEVKTIHGRELTSVEFSSYFKAYADLFTSGANFPEAGTLLTATSGANNTNAINLSISDYKEMMDRVAGPSCSSYVGPEELKTLHRETLEHSLGKFKSIANFGNKRNIDEAREKLLSQVGESFTVYNTLNDGRNPLAGFETYILPLVIALAAYILRVFADTTCSSWSSVCRKSSDFLSHLYAVVACFMLIIGLTKAQQIRALVRRVKQAFEVLLDFETVDKGKKRKVE
eukprot:CAMPEP_0194141194 /NCGR_PEP_ID=MMETSP0152-20130528/10655_1 /TAXON_ID=1049557 /ORGANISM="Thalassiothrix antarctica, Strain L6-D1" /LENGTH=569 /DNA_ID=CAMNT_0038839743 /DNA_START=99 /DNA_END=1808 /DNA_ORIENTATION=-